MESVGRCAVVIGSSTRTRLLLAVFFTAATAACAQVSFRLWYTPVPVTLQVLGVLLSGLVLGSRWGAISQLQYLAMGAAGLPLFAGWTGGPAAFAGPTGGYLIGFVPGAFAAGWVFEKLGGRAKLPALAAGIAGLAVVYAFGASWLGFWLGLAGGRTWDGCIGDAWRLGVVPFIGVDLLKAATASGLALGGRSCHGLIRVFRSATADDR